MPDVVSEILEIAMELVTPSDGVTGDGHGTDVPVEMKEGDGSGIVIPVEAVVEPEEKPAKDGCSAQPAAAPGALSLALLLVLALVGLRRHNQTVR